MRIEPLLDWRRPGAAADAARPGLATVWRVPLDIGPAEFDRAIAVLASDEKERAARFRFPLHRQRFVAARAALRITLGEQLAIDPRDVSFRYTDKGKPELVDDPELQFNLAHSDDLCMIAVARGRRLGIDVEVTRARRGVVEEVARSLHPAERRALAALDAPQKEQAFYRCWVRKEAWLKALGIGLGAGLDRFHVDVGDEARLVWSDAALGAATDWTLFAIDGEGYAAALAIECAPVSPSAQAAPTHSHQAFCGNIPSPETVIRLNRELQAVLSTAAVRLKRAE